MRTIIIAYDKKRGIGADNDLLWRNNLPADLQHFKEATTGHAVIMGFHTYQSIGRPLPGRQNIVISHNKELIEGFDVVASLQAAYNAVKPDKDIFVIGGGKIYAQAIDSVDRILATEVRSTFNHATIFSPDINSLEWVETQRIKHRADDKNLYDYDFVTYERRIS